MSYHTRFVRVKKFSGGRIHVPLLGGSLFRKHIRMGLPVHKHNLRKIKEMHKEHHHEVKGGYINHGLINDMSNLHFNPHRKKNNIRIKF